MRSEIPFGLQDRLGNALNGVAHVYLRGTTTEVPVYSGETGTGTLPQPLAVTNGTIPGWFDEGRYDIVATSGPSSITRPWDSVTYHYSNGINIKDFGALGDGVTDDTAAIQAAITAAAINGRIYVPVGIFHANTLSLLDGQELFGPGTIKRHSGTAALITISGKMNIKINCTLDGALPITFSGNSNNDTFTATSPLVDITGSTYCQVQGRCQNNGGNAVRIYDSSYCKASADIYNCNYGVVIGSGGTAGDPGGGAHRNIVGPCTMSVIGKNGVFVTGRTDSGSSPNTMYDNEAHGVIVYQAGDAAFEIGQGTNGFVGTNLIADGNNKGNNGILIRDAIGVIISGFRIKNYGMFANGGATYLTLGNGVYFWPQYTGTIKNCTVIGGEIENCSRGIFLQGNNTTSLATDPVGGAGNAGQIYAGIKLANIVVDGTQTGTITGADATAMRLNGFYVQSVSGVTLTNCTAKNCLNDGFRIGDINQGSSYVTHVTLLACQAWDNGQQAIGGQTYYGFFINGTSNQAQVKLNGCRGFESRAGGSRTQHYGFGWNATGSGSGQMISTARLIDCTGGNNLIGTYNSVGSDMTTLGGTVDATAGNITILLNSSHVYYSGTGGHTATLPSALLVGQGHKVFIRNNGTGALTVTRSGSATMVGPTSLAAGAEHLYVTDGSANWY